jgi:hypothetical protein
MILVAYYGEVLAGFSNWLTSPHANQLLSKGVSDKYTGIADIVQITYSTGMSPMYHLLLNQQDHCYIDTV